MCQTTIRSILIIDDDQDDYEIVEEALQQIDPAITVFFLDKCEERSKYSNHSFDIVLLDINMPFHDGFTWLRGIRASGYRTLPVVMYTSSSNPAHMVKAYDNGATLYFTKPENFSDLVKGLKKLLAYDWSHPASVTQMHYKDGKYTSFKVA
jgi:DNA-binding response OmpR family regulator